VGVQVPLLALRDPTELRFFGIVPGKASGRGQSDSLNRLGSSDAKRRSSLPRWVGIHSPQCRRSVAYETGSPLDRAVFTIAQRERSLIAERVRAGLRRARGECKHLGCRPLQVDPRDVESVIRR